MQNVRFFLSFGRSFFFRSPISCLKVLQAFPAIPPCPCAFSFLNHDCKLHKTQRNHWVGGGAGAGCGRSCCGSYADLGAAERRRARAEFNRSDGKEAERIGGGSWGRTAAVAAAGRRQGGGSEGLYRALGELGCCGRCPWSRAASRLHALGGTAVYCWFRGMGCQARRRCFR